MSERYYVKKGVQLGLLKAWVQLIEEQRLKELDKAKLPVLEDKIIECVRRAAEMLETIESEQFIGLMDEPYENFEIVIQPKRDKSFVSVCITLDSVDLEGTLGKATMSQQERSSMLGVRPIVALKMARALVTAAQELEQKILDKILAQGEKEAS